MAFLQLRHDSYPLQLRLYQNKLAGQSFLGLSSRSYLNLFCSASCQKDILRWEKLSQLLVSLRPPFAGLESMETAGQTQVAAPIISIKNPTLA